MDFQLILIAVAALAVLGFVLAMLLFVVSKKFAVKEDPRIGQVAEVLPGANCGGCGFPGCGGMAAACVKAADAGSLDGLNCPVGGAECMKAISGILGMEVSASAKKIAVVRCDGTCELNRPRLVQYDGVKSCRVANSTSRGETACQYGCLGCGDCVNACQFDAIKMDPQKGLVVDAEKCTSCGACAKACPRGIIEIRAVSGANCDAYYVNCVNKQKGAAAMKACDNSCIACKKCESVCGSDAVHIENNVAIINPEACVLCGQCFDACPRGSIVSFSVNGIVHKKIEKKAPAAKPATAAAKASAAPAQPAKEWKPIEVKFDGAPLMPSQQILLAGPKDLSNPVLAGKEVQFESKRTDAPLPPSQMILLGLK